MIKIIETSIFKDKFNYFYQKYSQLTSQSIINFIAQVLINLFNIFLFFYISKIFSNYELSIFLYITAICRIFSFLFDAGFNQLILSEFNDNHFRKSLFKIFFLRNFISLLIIFIIYLFFNFFNYLSIFELNIFIILIFFYLSNENLNYFFSIIMSLNKNILIVFSRLIFLVCAFFIFFIDFSFKQIVIYLALINLLPLFFIFFMSYLILRKENLKAKILNFDKILKIFLFYSSFLIMAKGIGEINSNVDMIFIKNMTNEFLTSLYGLIIKINQLSLIPHMLLGSMILPYFASLKDENKMKENLFELRYLHIISIYLFAVLLIPVFYFSTSYFKQFSFDLVNFETILMFNLLMCFLISLSFHFQQILIVQRKYFHLFLVSILALMINLSLNFILIKKFHIYGAMITSMCSHLIIYILYLYLIKSLNNFGFVSIKDLNKYFNILFLILFNIFFSIFYEKLFIYIFIISNLLFIMVLIHNFLIKPLKIK